MTKDFLAEYSQMPYGSRYRPLFNCSPAKTGASCAKKASPPSATPPPKRSTRLGRASRRS